MNMKKERRRLYLRCFALLLALWLALMAAFSRQLLKTAQESEREYFILFAQTLYDNLVSNWQDYEYSENWEDLDWSNITHGWESSDTTAALFSYEGDLLWAPDPPGHLEVTLYQGLNRRETVVVDIARWFDLGAIYQTMREQDFPTQVTISFRDVVLTEDGEAVPKTLVLENGSTIPIANFPNKSFDQYQGTLYEKAIITTPQNLYAEIYTLTFGAGIDRLQAIAADPASLWPNEMLYVGQNITSYTIDDRFRFSEKPWGLLDRTYVTQVGMGPIVQEAVRMEERTIPFLHSRPTYWLVFAGQSNVWKNFLVISGSYWLTCVLISLAGFLAAAWILAHTSWKGQRTHILYERRTRETAAALAHDLKTPLAVIRACAENLAEDVQPEKRGQYIGEIDRQVQSMDRSLLDMLELNRVRSAALRREAVDLRELVAARLEALSPLLQVLDVSAEVSGEIQADREQLARLLDNFLSNAAAHSGGIVRVQGDQEQLWVYNSGRSIPEEDLPRIWEPYFKGDAARRGGSGLGLALAAEIAEAHGWRCGVENREDGVRFTVHFQEQRIGKSLARIA